jgi:hypothetical protein
MSEKRKYQKQYKILDERTKLYLEERYKGERTSFRRQNRAYIVPFSQEQYPQLFERYQREFKEEKRLHANAQAKKRRDLKNQQKERTFIISITYVSTCARTEYVHDGKTYIFGDEITETKKTNSMTRPNAEQFILDYVENERNNPTTEDSSVKDVRVIGHTVEFMNERVVVRNSRPRERQPMTRSFVLRNDWLKHGKGIAEYAYENSEGKCVYHQLTQFLLNPPTGNPTKFICKRRTGEESLFAFFQEFLLQSPHAHEYPNFNIYSGVSTEMMASLCRAIKRNMYAYDGDNKIFYTVAEHSSNDYCPLVFYKLHGHLYMIDDPSTILSVAAENRKTGTKIISTTLLEKPDIKNREVTHLDFFDIPSAKSLKEGLYMVKQHSLDTEVMSFIQQYQFVPMTKTKNSSIVQIQYQEGLIPIKDPKQRKYVTICIDATYGTTYNYQQMQNVATHNQIFYTNGGIGSLIMSVLNKSKRDIDVSNTVTHIQDKEGSVFNQVVLDNVVKSNEFKTWQFVERVADRPISNHIFKIDMRKCRRNLTYHSHYKWPVYSVMDIPRPFSGKIQCGYYYVETEQTFPFRGNGWYSQPLIDYGLSEKLITQENIRLELIPSDKLPQDHFQKPIDTLLEAFTIEPSLQKLSINSMIGLMGRTKHTSSYTKFTLCPHEASTWWGEKNSKTNVFIRTLSLDKKNKLYEGIFCENVQVESTKYPLYKQILEMEAIELHRLESLIISKGGVILDRNTDAVRYARNQKISVDSYFWDVDSKIMKYQEEEPRCIKNEVLPRMVRDQPLNPELFVLPWNIQKDYEGTAEEEACRIVNSGKSCHIDGRAGTGKSYLVNRIMDELRTQSKKFMGFSPTNKGARIIGGHTIHSIYYKYQSNKSKLFTMIEPLEYIFIDEVSMMTEEFYQLFILIKRTFYHIKFIIAGDFGQLPPVQDDWIGDYENSPALNLLCDGTRVQLGKCRRSDDALYQLCLNTSKVDKHEFRAKVPTYLNLAYTHKTRMRINRECMERYLREHKKKAIVIPPDILNPKTQEVKLVKGMPVLAHTTNKKLRFMNSQLFMIQSVDDTEIVLSDTTENPIKIPTKDFHQYFYLGFCLTIHASQGETFTEKYTIHDWYRLCDKAKYVALSRGSSIHNIQIT